LLHDSTGMVDFIDVREIPERLRGPLGALLRGEDPVWPDVSEGEREAFAVACQEHAIGPFVYDRRALPELRSLAIHAAVGEPARLDDLRTVLAALEEGGVVPFILKGTALAYDVYPRPELRPRGDVDLLIDARDRERAAEVLHAIGFSSRRTSGDELAVRQQSFLRSDRFGFVHVYDVHWEIVNPAMFAGTLRYDDLQERAMILHRIGANARTLPHAEALLLACVHRVAHHHDSERLIWLLDIQLLRAAMSPDEHRTFWQFASERGVVTICRRSIELAGDWFGPSPHDGAEQWLTPDQLAADEPSRVFLNRHQTRGALLVATLASMPGWRLRGRRLRQLAFPPPAYMFESFGTHNRLALPWLYVWRGVRGMARLLRRVADS
jgi:hypothetical protein